MESKSFVFFFFRGLNLVRIVVENTLYTYAGNQHIPYQPALFKIMIKTIFPFGGDMSYVFIC